MGYSSLVGRDNEILEIFSVVLAKHIINKLILHFEVWYQIFKILETKISKKMKYC